jgi:hypothetical protein
MFQISVRAQRRFKRAIDAVGFMGRVLEDAVA